MLLPEQVSDLVICGPHPSGAHKNRRRFWRTAIRCLQFSGLRADAEVNPAIRVAKLVMMFRTTAKTDLNSDDAELLRRLERQLSITEDPEARRLILLYLSEP